MTEVAIPDAAPAADVTEVTDAQPAAADAAAVPPVKEAPAEKLASRFERLKASELKAQAARRELAAEKAAIAAARQELEQSKQQTLTSAEQRALQMLRERFTKGDLGVFKDLGIDDPRDILRAIAEPPTEEKLKLAEFEKTVAEQKAQLEAINNERKERAYLESLHDQIPPEMPEVEAAWPTPWALAKEVKRIWVAEGEAFMQQYKREPTPAEWMKVLSHQAKTRTAEKAAKALAEKEAEAATKATNGRQVTLTNASASETASIKTPRALTRKERLERFRGKE